MERQPKIVYRGTSLGWICAATEMAQKETTLVRGINSNVEVYGEENSFTARQFVKLKVNFDDR